MLLLFGNNYWRGVSGLVINSVTPSTDHHLVKSLDQQRYSIHHERKLICLYFAFLMDSLQHVDFCNDLVLGSSFMN